MQVDPVATDVRRYPSLMNLHSNHNVPICWGLANWIVTEGVYGTVFDPSLKSAGRRSMSSQDCRVQLSDQHRERQISTDRIHQMKTCGASQPNTFK